MFDTENLNNHIKTIQKINNPSSEKFNTNFYRVTYLSNNYEIEGLLIRPKEISEKLPVIIYNRGGWEETDSISSTEISDLLNPLAAQGFLVLASEYRSINPNDIFPACEAQQVQFVLSLIDVASSLDYADQKNIFMIGFSRGGIMTYLSIAQSTDIKAAAVIAGISNMFEYSKKRPDMQNILNQVIPELEKNKTQEYKIRSAVFWPEKINIPLLLIHNDKDQRVDVSQSINLENLLKQKNKIVKLITYNDNSHLLNNFKKDALIEIINWFNKYMS